MYLKPQKSKSLPGLNNGYTVHYFTTTLLRQHVVWFFGWLALPLPLAQTLLLHAKAWEDYLKCLWLHPTCTET